MVLTTIEHIVASPSRTRNARRLLLPVLISVVLIVLAVMTVAALVAPAWALGAIAAAGTGAVAGRRVSRSAAPRSRR